MRNELMIKANDGKEVRITSVELVDIINDLRAKEFELGLNGKGQRTLTHDNFMKKIRKEVEAMKSLGLDNEGIFKPSSYVNSQNKEQPCYSLNRDGVKIMLSSFRGSAAITAKKVANKLGIELDIIVARTRFEESFDSVLKQMCDVFGFEYETQVNIDNKYKLDFYFSDLNVVLEYDEQQHFIPANIKKDVERENYLIDKLDCTILRVDYKDSDVYNASLVIKELQQIKLEKEGR